MKSSLIRITVTGLALMLILLLSLNGCDAQTESFSDDEGKAENTLLGIALCSPEEAAELIAARTLSEAGVPVLYSRADGDAADVLHPVPSADREKKTTFYLPLDYETADWDPLTLHGEGNCSLYLVSSTFPQKTETLKSGARFRLLFCSDYYYSEAYLYFTGLPVVTLNLSSGEKRVTSTEIASSGSAMQFSFYDPHDPVTGTVFSEDCFGTVHIRGGTSRGYEKHSLKFSLYKDSRHTEQKNLSMCGLRRDDDWILNAMYQEETKIRDMLSYEIWEHVGMDAWGDGTVCGTRMRYVEVILSGKYWGLYGLCEPEDAKQFGIGEDCPGAVYKVGSWEVPTTEQIHHAAVKGNPTVAAVEVKYPDTIDAAAWRPFLNYVETTYETPDHYYTRFADEYMDISNLIDYWIFLNITSANDNTFKNMYTACRFSDGKLMMAPWDCDMTFGLGWDGSTYLHLYHSAENRDRIFSLACSEKALKLNAGGAVQLLKDKWAALREDYVTEDNLIALARRFDSCITDTGAKARDHSRWPKSGYADSIGAIESFIRHRLPLMDDYIRKLK